MVNILYVAAAGLIGYLFGSIPFGYIYVKIRTGLNLTEIGSGRTGGTNSFRAAGLAVGLLTSFSDVFKGFAGVWLSQVLLRDVLGDLLPWAIIAAGLMSVVGHNWSIFLKFGGGAGTGPNVGWAMAVWWLVLPIAVLVVAGLLLGVGMASIASLAMAAVIPVVFAVRYIAGIDPTPAYLIGGLLTALIVAWALRPNIRRLLNGTERVVGPRARRLQQTQK